VSLQCRAEMGAGEEIAMRAFKSVLDQLLRALGVRDASVELRDLALGEMCPGSTSAAPGGEQATDLRERDAGVLAEANEGDALSARRPVLPSLSGTPSG
jgi:hypothetical protein